ncbi:MAG: hypothetical protein JWM97_1986 [Phycisphaerales bacterium]|nr:hypothetical protein [Phycisphaerales bacterium]
MQQISYAVPTTDARHESEQVTRGDVACIAVRLVGVYAILQAFPALMTAIALGTRYGRYNLAYLAAYFFVPAGFFAMGIFLFTRAPRLGRRLLPSVTTGDFEQPGHGPTQLHAMAISIVGLLLFVWSAPSLAWLILSLLTGDSGRAIQRTLASRTADSVPPLLTHGVQAALGAWLFLGSKGLAAWWGRLRHPEFRGPDASQSEDASRSGDDTARID